MSTLFALLFGLLILGLTSAVESKEVSVGPNFPHVVRFIYRYAAFVVLVVLNFGEILFFLLLGETDSFIRI